MHPPKVLQNIYLEHGRSILLMAETLETLDVPFEDVDLLSRCPWHFLANRVAVERERLDLSLVHPLLHWKLPPPPPDWLTPAMCKQIFELALECQPDEASEADDEFAKSQGLVLPA